jgi:hypothetical protein
MAPMAPAAPTDVFLSGCRKDPRLRRRYAPERQVSSQIEVGLLGNWPLSEPAGSMPGPGGKVPPSPSPPTRRWTRSPAGGRNFGAGAIAARPRRASLVPRARRRWHSGALPVGSQPPTGSASGLLHEGDGRSPPGLRPHARGTKVRSSILQHLNSDWDAAGGWPGMGDAGSRRPRWPSRRRIQVQAPRGSSCGRSAWDSEDPCQWDPNLRLGVRRPQPDAESGLAGAGRDAKVTGARARGH